MLVSRDEISCDECGKRIESFAKPRGWENPLTAESHVCVECWGKEVARAFTEEDNWTAAIKGIKFPVRALIGRAVKDDVVEKVMDKYGIVP